MYYLIDMDLDVLCSRNRIYTIESACTIWMRVQIEKAIAITDTSTCHLFYRKDSIIHLS